MGVAANVISIGLPPEVHAGGAKVWALPDHPIGPTIARQILTHELRVLGADSDTVDGAALAVDEVVGNALRHVIAAGRADVGGLELWLYTRTFLRGATESQGAGTELVCTVFDLEPDIAAVSIPVTADPEDEHGRGLLLVDHVSRGRWGSHLTRSKLGHLAGKGVWFAVPTPVGWPPDLGTDAPDVKAATMLKDFLDDRGISGVGVTQRSGQAVIVIPGYFNVWCYQRAFHWPTPTGDAAQLPLIDLAEALERIVEQIEVCR